MRRAPRPRSAPLVPLALAALAACADRTALAPRGGRVRLNVAADVGLAGRQLEVRIDYRRAGGERPVLLRETFPADTGARRLPVVVDVGPCVRDPQRDTTAAGARGGCPLLLTLTLREAGGAAIDSATAGPLSAAAGDSVVTPTLVLRRTAALALSTRAVDVLVGQTAALTARAFDAAGQELTGRRVVWSSGDERVAVVGADGVVRAVAPGRTTIAAAREDVRATADVVVPAVRAITIAPAAPTLYATGSQRLTAAVTLEPGFSTGLAWRTSDAAVATVSDSGVVTAVAPGTATISAVATLDTVRRASTAVRVLPFQAVTRWVATRPLDPGPIADNVYGVWMAGPDDAYAAASGYLMRWDGTAWRPLATAGVSACCVRAVGGSGPANVVFAGFGGTIVRWDGTRLAREASGTTVTLNAVWVASPAFAVAVGDSGVVTTWDGTRWRAATVGPEPLAAVWGTSPANVWAGGAQGALYRYDGVRWTRQGTGWTENVTSLWGADSATAYAGLFDPPTGRLSVRRWTGTAWTNVALPPELASGPAYVFGSGRSDVYVVSGYNQAARFDGVQWRTLPPFPIDMWGTGPLGGSAVPGRAVVGGYSGVAFEWNGAAWRTINRTPTYRGLWAADGRTVFAVGQWGMIDRYDGTRWTEMRSGVDATLTAVWGAAANDVYAVGSQGTVLRYDGAQWTRMAVPTSQPLQGVSGTGPRDVWAVGGTVLHYDGAAWREVSRPAGFLEAVWAASPTAAFAVGGNGSILRFDGTAWRAMESPVRDGLHAVWGTSPTNVYAGGENGTLLGFDGARWRVIQRSGRPVTYLAIGGRGPADVYAVGCGAEATPALRFDGARWEPVASNWSCDFSLTVLPTEGAWAGGPFRYLVRGEGPRGTVGGAMLAPPPASR